MKCTAFMSFLLAGRRIELDEMEQIAHYVNFSMLFMNATSLFYLQDQVEMSKKLLERIS